MFIVGEVNCGFNGSRVPGKRDVFNGNNIYRQMFAVLINVPRHDDTKLLKAYPAKRISSIYYYISKHKIRS